MHHKTLQSGDSSNYIQNLTFFAGETETGRSAESFVEKVKFTDTPFEVSPDEWLSVEQANYDSLQKETAKSHKINVAFGLSDFADSPNNIEDSLYGNLVAKRTYRKEDGTIGYKEVGTVPCEKSYL